MPFQNLRVNSQFYILHKDGTPYVEVGAIAGVSNPVPDGTQPVMFGQPMKMVADIADANFPGGGNMVISGSRESMNSEVAAMRNRSAEILRSIDHHRAIVDACGKMMEILNPEFAERQRQEAENKALREEISELKAMMAELLKPAERPSTNNPKKQQV